MTLQLTTNQVWEAVEKESFAVIGMVTAKNEARSRTPVNGKAAPTTMNE